MAAKLSNSAAQITVQAWYDCSTVPLYLVTCHMHLSTSKNNTSPHKLSFQYTMRVGDLKLRYDLVWPNPRLQVNLLLNHCRFNPRIKGNETKLAARLSLAIDVLAIYALANLAKQTGPYCSCRSYCNTS